MTADGKIRDEAHGTAVCRFSFRKDGETGPWRPQRSGLDIKSGEKVNLYCHSVGLGPFSDCESPPMEAAPVHVTPDGKLFVPISSISKSSRTSELIRDYDLGTLSGDDTAAFEKMGLICDKSWLPSEVGLSSFSKKWKLPKISISSSKSGATTLSARFGSGFDKTSRLNYKTLQAPEWRDRGISWQDIRQQYYHAGLPELRDELENAKIADFSIIFE